MATLLSSRAGQPRRSTATARSRNHRMTWTARAAPRTTERARGIAGCSRAVGEGWELTNCGPFIYSWMTICGGQPTGWGVGLCLF